MKFIAERQNLLQSLSRLTNVSERKPSNPLLNSILMELDHGHIKLTTTDHMMTMSEKVEVMAENAGRAVTDAHMFHTILQKIPDGEQITCSYADSDPEQGQLSLHITTSNAEFQLACLPPETFPVGENRSETNVAFEIPAKTFENLIAATEFALSKETDNRRFLQGIYFHPLPEQGILRAVATNGHLMGIAETSIPISDAPIPSVIIPAKLIKIIHNVAKMTKNDVTPFFIELSDKYIHLQNGTIDIYSRLINEPYPNYEQIIPTQNQKELTVQAKLLRDAVDRIGTVSEDIKPSVRLSIEKDHILISARGQKQNQAKEHVPATYQSESLTVGFNQEYLCKILEHCLGTESDGQLLTSVFLKDSRSAILVHASETVKYILMPINT